MKAIESLIENGFLRGFLWIMFYERAGIILSAIKNLNWMVKTTIRKSILSY